MQNVRNLRGLLAVVSTALFVCLLIPARAQTQLHHSNILQRPDYTSGDISSDGNEDIVSVASERVIASREEITGKNGGSLEAEGRELRIGDSAFAMMMTLNANYLRVNMWKDTTL
jgi:hypothetical protein